MIRITRLPDDRGNIRLKVEGRLVGDWVSELDRVCAEYSSTKIRVSLDLSDVSFIDGRGVEVLRTLSDKGFQLIGASLWIQSLLEI